MKNHSKAQPYSTYTFRHYDPIMDQVRGAVLDSGLKIAQISECGVSRSTMRAWFRRPGSNKRRTRRPQFATIAAVAITCGATGVKFVDGKPVLTMPPRKAEVKRG